MVLKCKDCSAEGVRLWREYQSLPTSLLCTPCSEREQGKRREGDSIGWRVPAVPVDGEQGAFWSYCAVPDADARKWYALPETMEQRELSARIPLGCHVVPWRHAQ